MSYYVTVSGPFFRADADRVVDDYVDRVAERVADVGDARVEILHRAFFRHPTPFYWNQVHAEKRGDRHWVVTDGGIIYGHWLEGTGSMNSPRTRFPGYFSFRTTAASLRGNMSTIVEPVIRDLVRKLN